MSCSSDLPWFWLELLRSPPYRTENLHVHIGVRESHLVLDQADKAAIRDETDLSIEI